MPKVTRKGISSGKLVTLVLLQQSRFVKNRIDCFYCVRDITKRFTIDHYIPLKHGNRQDIGNLVLSCQQCNMAKAALIPEITLEEARKNFVKNKSIKFNPNLLTKTK